MNMYLKYFDGLDFNSQFHVRDLSKLFVNHDIGVALYVNGEFSGYYDLDDFYNLSYDDCFNDICLGIYIFHFDCYFIVNFGELEV